MKFKLTPDVYFIASLLLSVLFHFLFPIFKIIPYPYSIAGVILIVAGIFIAFRANFILLKNNTSLKPFEKASVLITSGPFLLSRNPVYLGMALILFGEGIFLGSLYMFIFPILFVVVVDRIIIVDEELRLEKTFGEKYLDYKSKVRRWV